MSVLQLLCVFCTQHSPGLASKRGWRDEGLGRRDMREKEIAEENEGWSGEEVGVELTFGC